MNKFLLILFLSLCTYVSNAQSCNGTSTTGTINVCNANISNTSNLGNVASGTWNGTIIAINKGGTGQTTSIGAFNALCPSQSGQSGNFLYTNGSNTSWANVTSAIDSTVYATRYYVLSNYLTANSTNTLTNKSGNISQWTNNSGYLTSINSSQVTTALGFTPYNSTNPNGYISGNQTTTLSGDATGSGTTAITVTLANSGVTAGTYDWITVDAKGRATVGANTPVPTAISAGARNFNQAYQISSTRPTKIKVSSQISCTLSLTSGQSGQIILELSADGSTNWIFSGMIAGSNTGSLSIGVNTAQITGAEITEDLPAGYFWRLRTNNITGTPTYTFNGGNERIY